MFAMLPLDSCVVLAIHRPYRYPNLAELHLRPIWLVFPHLGDLIVKGGILPRSCGELRIFSAGARNKGGEGGVLLHIVLEPGGRSIGAECEYTSHPLGMTHRQVEADDSSVAPTDNGRFVDFQRVEQRDDIVCHQIVGKRSLITRAAPVTTAVHQDHTVRLREGASLVAEIVGIGKSSVQQHDGRASADLSMKDSNSVDRVAGVSARKRSRRWRQRLPQLG